MTRDELRNILKRFCKIAPAFSDWRTRVAREQAAANQTDAAAEWSEQLDSWSRTLEDVSVSEAILVLGRMERDEIAVPPYGDIARAILREVKFMHSNQGGASPDVSGRRYKCRICRDTGLVHVWNPEFVDAYSASFSLLSRRQREKPELLRMGGFLAKYANDDDAVFWDYDQPDWFRNAAAWFYASHGRERPLRHMSLCNCDCDRVQVMRGEREKYYAGTRSNLPACGAADYNPDRMPIATADDFGDLEKWYSKERATC